VADPAGGYPAESAHLPGSEQPAGPWWMLGWLNVSRTRRSPARTAAAVPGPDRAGGPFRAHARLSPGGAGRFQRSYHRRHRRRRPPLPAGAG
jgi:hypothetical protein